MRWVWWICKAFCNSAQVWIGLQVSLRFLLLMVVQKMRNPLGKFLWFPISFQMETVDWSAKSSSDISRMFCGSISSFQLAFIGKTPTIIFETNALWIHFSFLAQKLFRAVSPKYKFIEINLPKIALRPFCLKAPQKLNY